MKIVRYEPTWEGFLTGIFEIFARKKEGIRLCPQGRESNTTLFECERLGSDPARAARVEAGLCRLGGNVTETVYNAWLSELEGIEDTIAEVLRMGFAENVNPLINRTNPSVAKLIKIANAVGWESHRMLQFVRFVCTPEGVYVADISTEYNVLTLIAGHFHGRFNDQRLIIRDVRRRAALVSDTDGWYIQALPAGPLPPLPEDGMFEDLWKNYFKIIANPARINTKLQQQFIPKRYRRFLTEFLP